MENLTLTLDLTKISYLILENELVIFSGETVVRIPIVRENKMEKAQENAKKLYEKLYGNR